MKANRSLTSLKRPWSPSMALKLCKRHSVLSENALRKESLTFVPSGTRSLNCNAKISKSKKLKRFGISNLHQCERVRAITRRCQRTVKLNDGDVVKIDLGAHVDGYIAVVAHTHVVGQVKAEGESELITGKSADVRRSRCCK